MKGVQQPPEYHPEGDVWVHTLLLLQNLDHPTLTLAMGALLHDVGKPPTFRIAERIRFDGHVEEGVVLTRAIMNRLRFSRDEMERVEGLVDNHMRFKDVPRMKESTLKRFLRLPDFDEHLELHRLDCLAGSGRLETYNFVRESYAAMATEIVRPAPLITGRELIAAGYHPGPQFKEMLHAVEDAQLEGTITTAGEALELLRDRYGKTASS